MYKNKNSLKRNLIDAAFVNNLKAPARLDQSALPFGKSLNYHCNCFLKSTHKTL